jgi:hypothetical protein
VSEWVALRNGGEGCTSFGRPYWPMGQFVGKLGKVEFYFFSDSFYCTVSLLQTIITTYAVSLKFYSNEYSPIIYSRICEILFMKT